MVGNPIHQLACERLGISMAISFLLGQHMPHGDQQLAGNGDDRFLFADALGQALELPLPVGMMLNGNPGCFPHHPA